MSNGKSLPEDVINLWPEVFNDIKLNVVPLNYVHTIEITFKNSKVWELDFRQKIKAQNWNLIEAEVKSIIKQYEDESHSIDFRLDTNKIKQDVRRSTKKFLKNRKLK